MQVILIQLDDPMVIWHRAHESGVRPSNRARMLLLKAIAVREARVDLCGGVCEAVDLLHKFCDQGIRVHPLLWLISIALRHEFFDEAIWVAKMEMRRNIFVPLSDLISAIKASNTVETEERRMYLLSRTRALYPETPQQGKKRTTEEDDEVMVSSIC